MAIKNVKKKRSIREDEHAVDPTVFTGTAEGGEFEGTPIDNDEGGDKEPLKMTKAGNITEIVKNLSGLSKEQVARIANRIREETGEDEDDDEDDDEGEDKKKVSERKRVKKESIRRKRGIKEDDGSHVYDAEDILDTEVVWDDEDGMDWTPDHAEDGHEYHFTESKSKKSGAKMHMGESEDEEDGEGEDKEKKKFDEGCRKKGKLKEDDEEDEDEDEDEDELEEALKLRKEDLNIRFNVGTLFEGNDFTAEFKNKIQEDYTTAVLAAVNENLRIVAANEVKSRRAMKAKLEETMVKKMDKYLTYVAEEFIEENRLAIENGLRTELAENFMDKLKVLFEEHFFTVPTERVNAFDRLAGDYDRINRLYAKEMTKVVSLREQLEERDRRLVIESECKTLTDTEKAKIESLAENVDFVSPEVFGRKIREWKKTFLNEKVNPRSHDKPDLLITEDKKQIVNGDKVVSALAEALKGHL